MSDIHVVILAAGQGTRMKSALPEGPSSGRRTAHDRTRRSGPPNSLAPATITVVVGHRAEAIQDASGRPARHPVRASGAAARNRPRASAGRAAAGRPDGHCGVAFWRCSAPAGRRPCIAFWMTHRGCKRRRDRGDRRRSNGPTATAASSGSAAGSRGLSRSAMPRRAQAADQGNQQRNLRVRPGAALRRAADDRVARTPRASFI